MKRSHLNEVTAKVFSILFREKKWGKMDKGEGEGREQGRWNYRDEYSRKDSKELWLGRFAHL